MNDDKGRVISEDTYVFSIWSNSKKNPNQISVPQLFCLGSKSEEQGFTYAFYGSNSFWLDPNNFGQVRIIKN